jgi:hypothetical protein
MLEQVAGLIFGACLQRGAESAAGQEDGYGRAEGAGADHDGALGGNG